MFGNEGKVNFQRIDEANGFLSVGLFLSVGEKKYHLTNTIRLDSLKFPASIL
jgi:hypothetical protein